jgi:hypothetical protein
MARKKITPKEYSEVATGVRLSSHEKLCAERMKVLNENINELRKDVKSLRQDMSKGMWRLLFQGASGIRWCFVEDMTMLLHWNTHSKQTTIGYL